MKDLPIHPDGSPKAPHHQSSDAASPLSRTRLIMQWLLAISALILVAESMLLRHLALEAIVRFAVGLTLVLGIVASGANWKTISAIVLLAVVNEIALFVGVPGAPVLWIGLNFVSSIIFGLVILGALTWNAWTSETVEAETLVAAAAAYLVLGFWWGHVFGFVDWLHPGAFAGACKTAAPCWENGDEVQRLTYFAFVSMTTLGYGDIVPLDRISSSVAVLSAVSGQLYLAFLVARLVSLYRPRRQR